MKIVTAYNEKFKSIAEQCIAQADSLGYKVDSAYLGDVDVTEEMSDGYISKSIFKPSVVKEFMEKFDEPIMWIDADTLIQKPFEIEWNFDIGVSVRKDFKGNIPFTRHGYRMGKYNAGVILFNNTDMTKRFIDHWLTLTHLKRNDQLALNLLLSGHFKHFYSDNLVIREFSHVYNDDELNNDTIIYHLKGNKHAAAKP